MESPLLNKIIEASLLGQEDAFYELYKLSVPKIRRQMRRSRVNDADIEDIIQETMMRVHEQLKYLRNHACYEAWLYKIAKSVFLYQIKINKCYISYENIEFLEEERTYMMPQNCIDRINTIKQINRYLAPLKLTFQKTLILRYINEMSEEEIAKELNIPKGTVKSRLHYARIKMQLRS